MATKNRKLSGQLRDSILSAGVSRYQISEQTGVPQGALSRFVNHKGGLSLDSIDKISECLGLQLVAGGKARPKKGK